jgi:microsomal dipeptidase-like Zn-dependent dipeptidase
MATWNDLPGLTAELLRRGYGEAELRKVYGGNFARVLAEVCGA